MPRKPATIEQLERATHNRLKGRMCYHLASSRSQLSELRLTLYQFSIDPKDNMEAEHIDQITTTLNHIENALEKFNLNLRAKLKIGTDLKRAISRKKVITQPFYPRPNSYP